MQLEAARALRGQDRGAQAMRHDDQRKMAEAWNHAKGATQDCKRAPGEGPDSQATWRGGCARDQVYTCGSAGRRWIAGEGQLHAGPAGVR
eukprot:5938519-Pyramimonas_sp.AAC.1